MPDPAVTGRFAPSPTGPLHFGSLVAAAGSWLAARSRSGRWLVRIEDLDRNRVVPGSEDEILRALERFGLVWDGTPVRQSERLHFYGAAVEQLRRSGLAFDCACSRGEIQRAASAPAPGEAQRVYPGTCRAGLPNGRAARAVRFRVPAGPITFEDRIAGRITEDVAVSVGDFVIQRADGPYAYQLAVVVDDAEQGITEVVRGGDLLSSTGRQIALQRALGIAVPEYAHLPMIVGPDGSKLGKRDGALPLPLLDPKRVSDALSRALAILGLEAEPSTPQAMLENALKDFSLERVPRALRIATIH
ncbi:MAG TPA: tRNA glutamyl-Q(34) synthetase GluQRS [Thermoanaerobaculia bacterium]|nr:tRNA glutamyl-Q(34) synthetase GluQRS [Thermoanaerobaculia bacterium]